jgi:tRNA (guanine-N7-)-methyltransferase
MTSAAGQPGRQRPIRSFVLREGRMTEGQRQALDRLWPRFGVGFSGNPLDLPALFGNDRPVYLEIGFGNGDALARRAAQYPEFNHLGIEVHRPGVGHLLQLLEQEDLDNVRVLRHDAAEILRDGLAPGSLQGLYLFFPDPWPKKKHHKRRIVQPSFVTRMTELIRPGGTVHMATDWQDYAEQMLACLQADDAFQNTAPDGGYLPRPEDRPETRFERRGQRLGHGTWDLLFRRL